MNPWTAADISYKHRKGRTSTRCPPFPIAHYSDSRLRNSLTENTGMSAEKTAQVILIQQPHERTGLFQGQPAHPHQLTDPFHFQPVEIGDQALSRVPFEDRTQISRTDV